MTAGRPPAPIEQKRKRGTLRADRTPNVGSLAVVPAIKYETWQLSPTEAVEKVLADGVTWISETDAPKVTLLRETLEVLERAKAGGMLKDQLAAIKQASSLVAELGFDPTARARLGLAEVKAASTLEKLRAAQKK